MRITRRAPTRPIVVLVIAGCGTAENSGGCAEPAGPSIQTSESDG